MTPEVIKAAVWLADTLVQENTALADLDLARAAGLLEHKTVALRAFGAARAQAGSQDQAGKRGAADDLRHISDRLALLVSENRRLLERAILVQGRVIGTIARAVPRALAADARGYRRDGAPAQARHSPAVALSARA